MEDSDLVVGIDLGTTNSCAACFVNGSIKILENNEGGRTTPSFVSFPEKNNPVVGKFAKHFSLNKPERGVSGTKRFIGKQFREIQVLCDLSHLPFQIKSASIDSDEPIIVVKDKNEDIVKTPEEIAALILTKIKADVSAKLGENINKAVITVPAHFNVSQRKATLEASNQAGFTVLKLLNEPTAAALSYYYEKDNIEVESYSLVYDLGGGTFDVAILKKHEEHITIIGVDGDSHLGGHDFDELITKYLCEEMIRKYKYNPTLDIKIMRRLNNESVTAKESLSTLPIADIYLQGFSSDVATIEISLTRDHLEEMLEALFKRTIAIVERCLKNSKLRKSDISEIILAGGSTRIPKIQTMISDYFDGKVLNKTGNLDECVAAGAALQAAMLSKNEKQATKKMKMIEVISSSLGVADFTDEMNFIITKNSPIPTSGSISYTTVYDQQRTLKVEIYEGERMDVRKNICLGDFKITDLTPAPPGKCKIIITMSIDLNGILTVTAKETFKENSKNLEITYTKVKRESANVMKYDREYEAEDERFAKFAKFKRYIFNYCTQLKYNLVKKNLTDRYKDIYEMSKKIEIFVKQSDLNEEKTLRELGRKLREVCDPLITRFSFEDMP